jgi:hypothetical protein
MTGRGQVQCKSEHARKRAGKLNIIASIAEPQVIAKILSHLQRTAPEQYQAERPLGAREAG